MLNPKYILSLLLLFAVGTLAAQESKKLTGTVIGTEYSVDYGTGQQTTTVNTKAEAFDGNLDTYFASYDRSRTWLGLDLGKKHVITKLRWSPRNDGVGPGRVVLAFFEGANNADFSDAFPLYLNDTQGVIGQYQEAEVNVGKAFRYVRYVGPNNGRCNIAEIEFWGYESEGTDEVTPDNFYRPTNLPTVSIHVENAQEPYDKYNDLNCSVTLIPADENDTVKVKEGVIKLRGNASIGYDKKPYRIKFSKKHHVFGSPASAKKWVLINNWGDKTLMRNILAFDFSSRMGMEYTPFIQPVDVFVNGEYKGCYQLCDHVDVNKNRVDIEEMDSTCISGDELTGGYMIEVDAYADQEPLYFNSSRSTPVTYRYPDSDDITTEQQTYIKSQYNFLESKAFNSTYKTESGFRSRMNLDSFLKHFLVGEFSGNIDTYWSVFLYKHRNDDHFFFGPVWDFDLAYENDYRVYPTNDKTNYIYTVGSHAGNFDSFVTRILTDNEAVTQLKDLWAHARKYSGVNEDTLLGFIDDTAEELNESQRLNFIRWPILSQYVHMNWQACGTYQGEVDIVKDYVKNRIAWLDKKLSFDATGVETVDNSVAPELSPIYTLDGKNMGTDVNNLPKGIYIRGGKKFVVR